MMIDAVAAMDADALHELITDHGAGVGDIAAACQTTGVDLADLSQAYTAWLNTTASAARARRHDNPIEEIS